MFLAQEGFTKKTQHGARPAPPLPPPGQARTPGQPSHPWKLPGTVILRLTSAFMTRLTISYRDPDMFLVSRPSKRFSTSSLQREEGEVTGAAAFQWHTSLLPGQWEDMNSRTYSLIHVESQRDVLILGEEEDQEVVTGLALLDGGI